MLTSVSPNQESDMTLSDKLVSAGKNTKYQTESRTRDSSTEWSLQNWVWDFCSQQGPSIIF